MDLQGPDVGHALTTFFGISAGGRLPFTLEQNVVPVCLVGDVSSALTLGPRPFASGVDLPALAGNFGAYTLLNTTLGGQKPRTAYVEKIVLYTQTTALFRLSFTATQTTAFTVPAQRRTSKLATDPAHCSLYNGNVGIVIPAGFAAFSFVVPGNVPFQLDIPASGILVEAGGRLEIGCTTANLATSCGIMWREEDER